jgi:multidrug efflux system membrane fusion protein
VLGAAEAPWQAVTKGLEAGDRVVIEGVDRLREGRPVLMVEKDGQSPPPPSANAGAMGKGGPGAKGPKGGGKEGAKK